jgi:hypothetical protein
LSRGSLSFLTCGKNRMWCRSHAWLTAAKTLQY